MIRRWSAVSETGSAGHTSSQEGGVGRQLEKLKERMNRITVSEVDCILDGALIPRSRLTSRYELKKEIPFTLANKQNERNERFCLGISRACLKRTWPTETPPISPTPSLGLSKSHFYPAFFDDFRDRMFRIYYQCMTRFHSR